MSLGSWTNRLRALRRAAPIVALFVASAGLPAAEPILPPQSEPPRPAYASRVWRTQEGLPENRIRSLAQTPDGYLWVGTTGGLARFDGVRFVVYTRSNTPAIMEDHVRDLSVAADGTLWASTDGGGLLQYEDGQFRSFGLAEGLGNEFVNAALQDSQGNVYAATARGLYLMRDETFERIDEELRLTNIAFFSILERRDGSVLAAGQSGVFLIEQGRMRPFGKRKELEEVYIVAETADESLWLATNNVFRAVEDEDQGAKGPQTQSVIGAISQDHAGNMLFGTQGDGLFVAPAGSETAVRFEADLPDRSVYAVIEDRERNIWVGTADGLVRLSVPDVEFLNQDHGLNDDNVLTVYSDRSGILWLTTVTGAVFRYENGAVEEVSMPVGARGLRLRGTYADRTGAFWFGTGNQGVVRIKDGNVERFTTANGLRNNAIEAFYEDRQGMLWVGTTSGLSRWDGKSFRNYYLEDGLCYGWVRTIAEDHNGDMLVGTDRGMSRFHDGKFVVDPAFEPLKRDRIWSIFPDGDGTLWIATRGSGLVRLRNGQASRITTREGLQSNSIFQLVGDGKTLWMSGPLGISSAPLAGLNSLADGEASTVAVFSYGISDGSGSAEINGGVQPAGHIAPDGELWFPSVKGALHFNPARPLSHDSFPVRIESALIDEQPAPTTGELVIGPGRHRVKIEFTACSLRSPGRVSFRYQLTPFDRQWTNVAGSRAAYYDNLPPGKYRFEVVASDGPLASDTSQAGFSVVVKPYIYQTGWFYALCVALAGALGAGVFLYQGRQTRERYNLLLAERTRIAREMHDTVVQDCIGISTLLEAAVVSAGSDQDQMLECLDDARLQVRLALDGARQALTDLRHDSFARGLSGALVEFAKSLGEGAESPVTLEVVGPVQPLADSTNRALLLVAREAVRNALVHGAAKAVKVRLAFEQDAVRLEIRDNGCGFKPPTMQLATFGHFGILGMRERMEQLGGSLEVTSSPGRGTTVCAVSPLASGRLGLSA
jgi:ligand-binding sensor domain-containing protein/two-component sensor histidine kinase